MQDPMFDKLNDEIKTAMKSQEKDRLLALRMLKARIIENNTSLKPVSFLDVVIAHNKKLLDSLEHYAPGTEHHQKIVVEMENIKHYLPQAMEKNEVEALVKQIVGKLDKPQLGLVMKELTPQIKGRFDMKVASEIVNGLLKS